MTRIDSLRALEAAVKAGTATIGAMEPLAIAAFPDDAGSRAPTFMHVWAAYRGSLDAALALHRAILPEWMVSTMCQLLDLGDDMEYTGTASDWMVNLARCDGSLTMDSEVAETPARAWLLAILAALIAEAERDLAPAGRVE